jgi:hypothetical protein
VDPDRIEAALAGLGPESRALVELSVIREVADDDIASLLGTDEGAVRSRREDALAVLAADLGADSSEEVGRLVRDMKELPAVRWRDDDVVDQPPPAEPEPPAEPTPPVVQPGAKRKRRVAPLLLVGLVAAAAVALVLALSGGEEKDKKNESPAPSADEQQAMKRSKLLPLTTGSGEGTAEVRGRTLEISVIDLPDPGTGGYVTWLYNSISDARPLNRPQRARKFDLKAKLPEGADRYRFIDVSLEPADDNQNHSGESVLRSPLPKLR